MPHMVWAKRQVKHFVYHPGGWTGRYCWVEKRVLTMLTLGDCLLLMTTPDNDKLTAEIVYRRLQGENPDVLSKAVQNAQTHWRKRLGVMMANVKTLTP